MSNYTKPELRKRIVARVKAGSKGGKPGQWSARKAQIVAQKYKEAGGGYKKGGLTKKQESMKKWTKQKWRTASGKPSVQGKDATGEAYMPAKAVKQLQSTAAGRKKLAAANKKKRAATKKGEQFAKHGLHKGKDRSA